MLMELQKECEIDHIFVNDKIKFYHIASGVHEE